VEQVLVEHPGVAEAVVVGLPDDRWGNRVAALVVPEPGVELREQELGDHVGSRLAGYKRPRSLFVVSEVERTVSGKVDRRRALERAVELAGPGS
jgi:fatty-acyl-CoA synthase